MSSASPSSVSPARAPAPNTEAPQPSAASSAWWSVWRHDVAAGPARNRPRVPCDACSNCGSGARSPPGRASQGTVSGATRRCRRGGARCTARTSAAGPSNASTCGPGRAPQHVDAGAAPASTVARAASRSTTSSRSWALATGPVATTTKPTSNCSALPATAKSRCNSGCSEGRGPESMGFPRRRAAQTRATDRRGAAAPIHLPTPLSDLCLGAGSGATGAGQPLQVAPPLRRSDKSDNAVRSRAPRAPGALPFGAPLGPLADGIYP